MRRKPLKPRASKGVDIRGIESQFPFGRFPWRNFFLLGMSVLYKHMLNSKFRHEFNIVCSYGPYDGCPIGCHWISFGMSNVKACLKCGWIFLPPNTHLATQPYNIAWGGCPAQGHSKHGWTPKHNLEEPACPDDLAPKSPIGCPIGCQWMLRGMSKNQMSI